MSPNFAWEIDKVLMKAKTSNQKAKTINQFEKLPLAAQAYVKSEVERRLAIASESLQKENRELARRNSLQSWIRFAIGVFFAIGLTVGTYLIAPDKICEYIIARVDEKVTVPEIDNAAQRVLSEKLDVLSTEKMKPFEERAMALQGSLSNSVSRVSNMERDMEVYSDLIRVRLFDRDAFARVRRRGLVKDEVGQLCQDEISAIREQLILERNSADYLVMAESDFNGRSYQGPFTADEIYERYLETRYNPVGVVNAMRNKENCRCFYSLLLEVATKCKNLKTAECALAVLEGFGAPKSDVWHLSAVSNWVEETSKKTPQFPVRAYDLVKAKMERGEKDFFDAWELADTFNSLDKLRTVVIVEMLTKMDCRIAQGFSSRYADKNSRWKKTADCYFMSVTGGVDRGTAQLINCCRQYPGLLLRLNSDPRWRLQRFFNVDNLRKWVDSQRR